MGVKLPGVMRIITCPVSCISRPHAGHQKAASSASPLSTMTGPQGMDPWVYLFRGNWLIGVCRIMDSLSGAISPNMASEILQFTLIWFYDIVRAAVGCSWKKKNILISANFMKGYINNTVFNKIWVFSSDFCKKSKKPTQSIEDNPPTPGQH